MDGKKLVDLTNLFARFHQETASSDLQEFSVWLNRTFDKKKKKDEIDINSRLRKLVWLIHRLSKYFRFYSKKTLSQYDLNSMDEYFFLMSIHNHQRPAKNEVYKDTVTELTTGTQMMKRLIGIGLVKEVVDSEDRRVRRVQLTEKGEATRKQLFEAFAPELPLKVGNLEEQEVEILLAHLEYLENFHNVIYHQHPEETLPEIAQKHLLGQV